MRTNRVGRASMIALAVIVLLPLFVFIGGEIVMHLWNWLLPGLFGWRLIAFWQAVGVLALCRILFGSHGFRGARRSGFRRRMAERWENMTPEERERFRQGMSGGCGYPKAPAAEAKL
jgi:uncharacterized membrane protein